MTFFEINYKGKEMVMQAKTLGYWEQIPENKLTGYVTE